MILCEWFRIHYVSVISSGESYCPGEGHSRRVWSVFEVSNQRRAVRVWEILSEWSLTELAVARGDCLLWSSRICHWQPCFLSPRLWLALCVCSIYCLCFCLLFVLLSSSVKVLPVSSWIAFIASFPIRSSVKPILSTLRILHFVSGLKPSKNKSY